MKSVALRISRHQRMGNLSLDDLRYRFVEVNERQIGDQCQSRVATGKVARFEFGMDGKAGD